jgi:hypothetical protein
MPEGRMTKIMDKSTSLRYVWVQSSKRIDFAPVLDNELFRDTPSNLCNFEGVSQAIVKYVSFIC